MKTLHPIFVNFCASCGQLLSYAAVLCLLTSVLCLSAPAQTWIIDGQQTQTLNLNVSDPQAFYSDGSREMSAPLTFAPELSSVGPLIRATVPWDEAEYDFFIFDFDEQILDFCTQDAVGLLFENLYLNRRGLFERATGISINFEEQSLNGGWRVQNELDEPYAIISRGSADARYLRQDVQLTQSLDFDSSATSANGALQIYASDSEENFGFFKTLDFQDGLQFSTSHSAALFFGQNSNDGLLIGPNYIMQTGYGPQLDFEVGRLDGVAWTVSRASRR